jgi:hypothetical protein
MRIDSFAAIATVAAVAAAGFLAGIVSLVLNWLQGRAQARRMERLRDEMDRSYRDCVRRIGVVGESLEMSEKNAQSSLELLRDGRLGMAARARALRMLRSGVTADTAAAELGLARNEVRLLEKVAIVLAPQD